MNLKGISYYLSLSCYPPSVTSESIAEQVVGNLRIDFDAHIVKVKGEEIKLTALEFKLLKHFLDRRGRVQSRDQLLQDVWGYSSDITTRTVDTHIKRLREKLGSAGDYIQTIRGVGYKFNSGA